MLATALSLLAGCSARSGGPETRGGGGGGGSRIDAGGGGGDVDGGGSGQDDGGGSPGPFGRETCDNSVDDDGNGLVDEGCACETGNVQLCWPGTVGRRGIGVCRDGTQVCQPYGEFSAWGECVGAVLPQEEVAGNCVDEDCDGIAPGCEGMTCGEFETCGTDGVDEECDGLADCADPDCLGRPGCESACTPSEFGESCTDGIDNDCDGRIDCADPDCAGTPACSAPPPSPGCTPEFPFIVEVACSDRRDNDCDGRIDCDDPDCRRPGFCGCAPTEAMCTDGRDDDCDRSTDCTDPDCMRCVPGARRWCDDPVYCHWGIQECGPDGRWGTCRETTMRPPGCTGSIYSRDCCVRAGECCENYPTDRTSVGDCEGIEVTCR
ncbi:MAG: hypothetical protein NZ898_05850 [Myxococcota bacterium]|nr:hypothetical protein [Myxococcota bacterium]MDW8361462.1 hypothetical protein [Myxococcales bacterium]